VLAAGDPKEIVFENITSLSIGKGEGANLSLDDPMASRKHAAISMDRGYYQITDSGSTNGTFVNGVKVTGSCRIKEKDRIQLGASVFEVKKLTYCGGMPAQAAVALPAQAVAPPVQQPALIEIRADARASETSKFSILFSLVEPKEPASKELHVIGPTIKIGKLESSHLRINHESVSRMHAVIELLDGKCTMIDLGSTRGSFVNGERIPKRDLQKGDTVQFGDVILKVERITYDAVDMVSEPLPKPPPARPPPLPPARAQAPVAPASVPRPAAPPVSQPVSFQPPARAPQPAGPPAQQLRAADFFAAPDEADEGAAEAPKARGWVKTAAVIAGVLAGGFAATAVGLTLYNRAERNGRIDAMAAEFKRCSPNAALPEGCLSETQKADVWNSAVEYEGQGKYFDAGRAYVRLRDWPKVREMIARCRNKEGNTGEGNYPYADNLNEMMRLKLDGQIGQPGRCERTVPKGCTDGTKRTALMQSAENFEQGGAYRDAGLIYAELGEIPQARRMVEKCTQGDKLPDGKVIGQDLKGAERIREMSVIRATALKKAAQGQ
jgi:pSer/pThr/pTyr-binding forkhead associated (FHA) protein